MSEIKEKYWERRPYVASEFKIDARWIFREVDDPNDPPKAWGSLRIVSHPDLRPGYLKAYSSFVTSRRPKTEEEIEQTKDAYKMEDIELEVYSVDEHITTQDFELIDTKRNLEERFGVTIFKQ